MDRQHTPWPTEGYRIRKQLVVQSRTAARIEQERTNLRELPLLQRLAIGNVARRLSLWLVAGRQNDLVEELRRQQRYY